MSKSFDDKIRERLTNFSQEPPADAKKLILEQVSKSPAGLFYFYQTLSAMLILVALFRIGMKTEVTPERFEGMAVSIPEMVVEQKKNQRFLSESLVVAEPQRERGALSDEALKISKESQPVALQAKDDMHLFQAENDENTWAVYDTVGRRTPIAATLLRDSASLLEIPLTRAPRYRALKRIVPDEQKWITPYCNLGAFFIYNRLRPNLDDDIYVGEYEAPFSLSASRIGVNAEYGFHKQWSEKLATRLGITVNNYSQSYSFSVRKTAPDSVTLNELDGFLEPHFNIQSVQISKRITLLGVKAQGLWQVSRNTSDVLFFSFEYQRLIGKGPEFTYLDKEYILMNPNQYLAEIGWRKTLFEFRKGHLYAMPNIRYALNKFGEDEILSVKPFSVGITISYGMK